MAAIDERLARVEGQVQEQAQGVLAVRTDIAGVRADIADVRQDLGDVKQRLDRVEQRLDEHFRAFHTSQVAILCVMVAGFAGIVAAVLTR